MFSRFKSETIFHRLQTLLPGGVNSPVRSFKNLLYPPIIAAKGEKEYLIDVDGNRYIDYIGSWGALLHGHNHPAIKASIEKHLQNGVGFGLSTEIEEQMARLVVERIPSVEKIRFLSSGTEATMTAIRLARGFTGRTKVVKFSGNYHGHSDLFLTDSGSGTLNMNSAATSSGVVSGVIRDTITLPYNDEEAVSDLFSKRGKEIACVILEPVAGNMGVCSSTSRFIHVLREETAKSGSLLIFDEVMTGFRLTKTGAQGIFPVIADLTCYGKIIGGGLAVSAVGGREEVMNLLAPIGQVYQAGTLSGNPLAMAAGLASLQLCSDENFYCNLNARCDAFAQDLRSHIEDNDIPATINQAGSMFTIFWGVRKVESLADAKLACPETFKRFYLHMLESKILLPPSQYEACFISNAHCDISLRKTLEAFKEFCANSLIMA